MSNENADQLQTEAVERELARTVRVRTGARKGDAYKYTANVWSLSVSLDDQTATIRAREPFEKERGVDILVTIPFETLTKAVSLMATKMKLAKK